MSWASLLNKPVTKESAEQNKANELARKQKEAQEKLERRPCSSRPGSRP
jgi:hypothetical protein